MKGDTAEGDNASDDEQMEEEGEASSSKPEKPKKAYIPGVSRPLREGEEWEFDPEAYRLFHSFETSWPCMSFDPLRDDLGDNRSDLPLTCFLVSGTLADRPRNNEICVMRISNLTAIDADSDESEGDDEDEENEEKTKKEPKLHAVVIPHHGGINRIRATSLGQSTVCAVWNDQAKVQLWNVTDALKDIAAMEGKSRTTRFVKERPLFSFVGHNCEGFALAWSPLVAGALASGGYRKEIHLWKMREGGDWAVDQRPLTGHSGSVEDLAWSPTEQALLISCSTDKSVRLWDTRSAPAKACVCVVPNAHESDVNVLSWNKHEPIIVTGGDDAALKVWALKSIQYGEPVARFKHHMGPITSVDWSPHESTTMLASGEDNQTTIWDLSVEADTTNEEVPEVPPQLLFVHMGQEEIKEVHWHGQIPGLALTTALTGFNVFKTVNF